MEATIEVSGLRKRFGSTLALDGMTFTVQPGRVTGFVGPNGAGKSTTMRVILGLDAPDAGHALVGGRPYRSLPRPLTAAGSLLDASALQPSRTGRNHLLWLAHSQGLPARRADEMIGQTGLGPAARRRARGYSLGMRQRLGLAAAMLGDPPVLLLDEPFNGLDPEGIVWMRSFLRALAARGRAILVSSHLMSELQDTADHLVIVGRGRVIADISTADLLAGASSGRVAVHTSAPAAAAAALSRAGAGVTGVSPAGADLTRNGVTGAGPGVLTASGLTAAQVVEALRDAGVPFSEVAAHRVTLETAYLDLTRDAVEFRAPTSPGSPARTTPAARFAPAGPPHESQPGEGLPGEVPAK